MNHRLPKVYVPYQREQSKLRALLTPIACAALTLAATACGAANDSAGGDSVDSENVASTGSTEQALTASDIDATKSLLVTDEDVVSAFTLKEVMDQLSNGHALALFHQMFATELQPGDPNAGTGPNCTGAINGWPASCPRAEGSEASSDPFSDPTSDSGYMPTTLSNRFDLAPADGKDCGEFRINFARVSGAKNSADRIFLAFEARLTNPTPTLGLAGCRPVEQFWQSLSTLPTATRAAQMHNFYMQGLSGFSPVISVHNFGEADGSDGGQVRIAEFGFPNQAGSDWSMREFRLRPATSGTLPYLMQPNFDKDVPARSLFDTTLTDAVTTNFQTSYFPTAVERLALQDVNAMNYPGHVPDQFNSGDSHMLGFGTAITPLFSNYGEQFGTGASAFRSRIQAQLTAIGSPLTPDNIVARATSLSCGGCHNISQDDQLLRPLGLPQAFPRSTGFIQVDETLVPIDGDQTHKRFERSALLEAVQPYRAQLMLDFLTPVPGFERTAGWTSAQSTLSLATASSTKTEGSSSLRVVPTTGWSEIKSIATSLTGSGVIGPNLKLDLFLPTNQPNPSFYGTVSVFVSSPAARINNQYLGQVSLNGLPTGKFSTLSFALPATTQRVLGYGLTDVTFTIQLNVNPNSASYYFDNLRFH
jgi:hypothetical protein